MGGDVSGTIELKGLTVHGHHGVYENERVQGQTFTVDVCLEVDLEKSIASDDVADTVHYGELADELAAIVSGAPVKLIETLASRLLDHCLNAPLVQAATVTVHKPHAPIPHAFGDVAVTLSGRRS
jgi:dihydroneopterin aldolase